MMIEEQQVLDLIEDAEAKRDSADERGMPQVAMMYDMAIIYLRKLL